MLLSGQGRLREQSFSLILVLGTQLMLEPSLRDILCQALPFSTHPHSEWSFFFVRRLASYGENLPARAQLSSGWKESCLCWLAKNGVVDVTDVCHWVSSSENKEDHTSPTVKFGASMCHSASKGLAGDTGHVACVEVDT